MLSFRDSRMKFNARNSISTRADFVAYNIVKYEVKMAGDEV